MRSDRKATSKREGPVAWQGPGRGGAEGAILAQVRGKIWRTAPPPPHPRRCPLCPSSTSKLPASGQLQEKQTAGMLRRVPWLTVAAGPQVPGAAALGGGPALLGAGSKAAVRDSQPTSIPTQPASRRGHPGETPPILRPLSRGRAPPLPSRPFGSKAGSLPSCPGCPLQATDAPHSPLPHPLPPRSHSLDIREPGEAEGGTLAT